MSTSDKNGKLRTRKHNWLHTVNPKLVREWHPTKNAPLTPKDVASKSHHKAWWICRKNHEWKSVVASRTMGAGCPYCSGHKVTTENSLQTASPQLVKQWHPTRNAPLTPRDVARCSNRKVWWLCRKGHEWEAVIANRAFGRECPYCSSRKVSAGNCLEAVNPGLAREWHSKRNAPLTPKHVMPNSHRKVWWLCRKGHEWEATVANRSFGRECPYCSGHRVSNENCLQIVYPKLAKEWHPVKNATLTPMKVALHSNKRVWWICKKGHEWEAIINNRSKGRGCPYCGGRYPTAENCLQTVSPWIAHEWHPIKNAPVTPKDIIGTSRREVWWKCRKGHELREAVVTRYRRGGCPVCVLKAKAPRLFERNA